MKLRRTRVLQTGSSNSRCVTAQGSTRYGWAQASFKTNAPHSELDSSPKRTQSTMGIRREQEAEDTWKRFGGKSEKEIVDERERLYKDDIQNTKLVHFSNQTVPETKLRDIKQMIQRKYANRKKFFNIFSQWDQQNKGQLSPQNVHFMLNSMGINVTQQQANVFVESYSENKSALNLNDFLGIIFQPKSLNVFIRSNRKIDLPIQKPPYNQSRVMQLIKDKQETFVKLVNEQTGNITMDKWKHILERSGVMAIREYEAERAFDQYRNQNVIDDKAFLEDLGRFDLNFHSAEEDKPKKLDSKAQLLMNYKRNLKERQDTQDLCRLNIQTMISSELQQTVLHAEHFKNKIRKYFSHRRSFDAELDKILKPQNQNKRITYEQLKNSMANLMRTFSEKFKRKELQAFLNMFVYNKDDQTQVGQLSKIIYQQTPLNFHERVDHRPRCLPPGQQTVSARCEEYTDISPLVKKIEDNLFLGRTKSYQLFKKLDKNHDGHLSIHEFSLAMKQMNILSESESEKVFSFINQAHQSGSPNHLNYREFSNFFKAGMASQEKDSVYPNFRHKRQIVLEQKSYNMDPRSVTYNQKKTRFSGNPKQTFNNFISFEKENDWAKKGDLNENIRFQRQQQGKQKQYYQNKLKWIKNQHNIMADRILEQQKHADQRQRCNLQRKADQMWAYNHVNHLKNEWK